MKRLVRFGVLLALLSLSIQAVRAGQEPLSLFQAYMATYAREQAYCHFSPALVSNLEKNWKKK